MLLQSTVDNMARFGAKGFISYRLLTLFKQVPREAPLTWADRSLAVDRAPLDRHINICLVKYGYMFGLCSPVLENYFKEGNFFQPGWGIRKPIQVVFGKVQYGSEKGFKTVPVWYIEKGLGQKCFEGQSIHCY